MPVKKTQQEAAVGYGAQSTLRIEFSAPNAREELVVVAWDGEQDLPLNGWQIRDSEARNTYTFGDLTLSPGKTVTLHSGGDAAQDSASDLYWDGGEDRWHEGDVLHLLDLRGLVQAQCLCAATTTRRATTKKKRTVKKQTVAKPAARKKRRGAKKKAASRATKSTAAAYDIQGALRIEGAASNFDPLGEDDPRDVVSIAWDGDKPLALKGWQVHYGDTGQRYTFGDVTLAPGSGTDGGSAVFVTQIGSVNVPLTAAVA